MDLQRLETLLDRHFDQALTAAEREELEGALLSSARARDLFWERAHFHGLLRSWGETSWGAEEPASPARFPARRVRPLFQHLAWAALALFLVFLAEVYWNSTAEPGGALQPAEGVAILVESADAVWEEPRTPLQQGQVLVRQLLKLRSGAVQIEFSGGARVLIEGPAAFELASHREGVLQHGRLRGFIPEAARGFLLRTPGGALADTSAEFACHFPPGGPGEVHVFSGRMRLETGAGTPGTELAAQEALVLEQVAPRRVAANPAAFLDPSELARRGRELSELRLAAWKASSERLARDPSCILHLDFEQDPAWDRYLPNRAAAGAEQSAVVIGCGSVEGRWHRKGALEFSRPDDRVRMRLPGSWPSLTLLAWVRIDSLPHAQNSLLMSESLEPGELHWYLYLDGSLGLGLRVGPPGAASEWQTFHSRPVFEPELFGSWVFLATVYDGPTQTMTHYFNGREAGTRRIRGGVPVRLEEFEIGNWGLRPGDPKWAQVKLRRKQSHLFHFRGRMDELSLLDRAAASEEVAAWYQEGNPAGLSLTSRPAPR